MGRAIIPVRWMVLLGLAVAIAFVIGMVCERSMLLSRFEEDIKVVLRPLYVESWPDSVLELQIVSSADGTVQKAMVYDASSKAQAPLLVSLHTWAGNYKTPDPIARLAIEKNWNYIHPDFRGANDCPEACLGQHVVSDINDSIEYGLKELNADQEQVMVVGMSGGGHAALGHLSSGERPYVRTYAVWCPVTDVEAWYHELNARGEDSSSVLQCCSKAGRFDPEEARKRSPAFMAFDQRRLEESSVMIRAGVLDGIVGKVPFSHSINFYNRCCRELNSPSSQVSEATQVSLHNVSSRDHQRHETIFSKSAAKIDLKLFFGQHEFLPEVAIEELAQSLVN